MSQSQFNSTTQTHGNKASSEPTFVDKIADKLAFNASDKDSKGFQHDNDPNHHSSSTAPGFTEKIKDTFNIDDNKKKNESPGFAEKVKDTLGIEDKKKEPTFTDKVKDTFGIEDHKKEPTFTEKVKDTFGIEDKKKEPTFTEKVKDTFGVDDNKKTTTQNDSPGFAETIKSKLGFQSDDTKDAKEHNQHH